MPLQPSTHRAERPLHRRPYPQIERQSWLDPETFEREYLARNRPVVVAMDPAWCARWAPSAIVERYGHHEIEAEETREVYVGDRALVHRSIRALVDAVSSGDPRERWKGLEFLRTVPGAREDLSRDPPPYQALMPSTMHGPRSTLWIAPRATMSSLHHDGNFDNLNLQVSGRKIFLLVPPPQHDELYRHGSAESPVNPFVPDLRRFPRFSAASPVEATLGPGDALLIPKYWWHCVYAIDTSVNLATCFSWQGELTPWRVLEGAPLVHRSLTVVAAELKRRRMNRLADATRRMWCAAYARLVPRVPPQARGALADERHGFAFECRGTVVASSLGSSLDQLGALKVMRITS
jgi:hypothetical protein